MRLKWFISNRKLSSKTSLPSKMFVTTPIYYVNSTPHIGHLYSSVIADAVLRWEQLKHSNILKKFSTGTDEHGGKIQQAATKNGVSVENYCVQISKTYKDLANQFNINYTDFISTTSERHVKTVEHFWKKLHDSNNIYSAKYSGWYCLSDETFLTESQLKEQTQDGKKVLVSAESGHPVEWLEEENYMFRLSHFQDDLIYWLKQNENVVKPKVFHKILMDSVYKDSLPDISVSRPASRVYWGIKVPNDKTQTIYVWLDALINYLTATGYPNETEFKQFWPPNVQVIGKDILKFHGIYWPAFLMAAKLELPHCILCHSHWTVEGEKMSKSKNNVVCPLERSEIFTTDGFRYFLLREGVPHNDGNYSDTKVIRILNSALADTFGNLLNRCCGKSLNFHQMFPAINKSALQKLSTLDVTKCLMEQLKYLPDKCEKHYDEYNYYKSIDCVMETLRTANLFFETTKPWEMRKDPSRTIELDTVIHVTIETLRVCAVLLQPVIPNLSQQLLDKINVLDSERTWESIRRLSWERDDFKPVKLSTKKTVLFRRILLENDIFKRKENV